MALRTWSDALPPEAAANLAALLGLVSAPRVTAQWSGATSSVIRWGREYTVKIPHGDPSTIDACLRHVRVAAAAADLGVRCARVILTTVPGAVLPVPVIVSTLLPGRSLAPGDGAEPIWREVGGQLALLHAAPREAVPEGLRRAVPTAETDPARMLDRLVASGAVDGRGACELRALRDRLVEYAPGSGGQVFCHGDMHIGNVVADGNRLSGLIDFAGAGWLDPAWDFAAMPLRAVPHAVAGYGAAQGPTETLRERIAWCRLQLVLDGALRGARKNVDPGAIIAAAEALLGERTADG